METMSSHRTVRTVSSSAAVIEEGECSGWVDVGHDELSREEPTRRFDPGDAITILLQPRHGGAVGDCARVLGDVVDHAVDEETHAALGKVRRSAVAEEERLQAEQRT